MAKNNASRLFPHFKLVLFIATLLVLPLIVFSANQRTNIQQHASETSSCTTLGGSCFYGQCSNGYFPVQGSTLTSCNSNGFYVCCTNKLSTPTGLKAYSSYCGKSPNEYDTINFNWNHVRNATSYTLYYRIYASGRSYTAVVRSGYDNTNYLLAKLKNLNGRRIQWYVKASNSYTSTSSKPITTPRSIASCP
jgi:hypothetical protein